MSVTDDFEQQLVWPEFRELYRYWRSKCLGDRLPARDDIDPRSIPKFLPGIFLVDVIRTDGSDWLGFRFRLAGTLHFEINQVEITSKMIEEAFESDHVERVRAVYSEAVRTRRPSVAVGARSAVGGRGHMIFDRLLLPLATDGQTVDMLLGHLRQQQPR